MEFNTIYLDISQAVDELNYARDLIELGQEEEAKTIIQKILKEIDKAREELDKLETKAIRLRGLIEEIEETTKEEIGEIGEEKRLAKVGEKGKEEELGELGEKEEEKELEIKGKAKEEKKPKKIKIIPEKEAMIVALSRLPTATPRIRMEAERIIRLYNLTEEDIEKLYRTFFE